MHYWINFYMILFRLFLSILFKQRSLVVVKDEILQENLLLRKNYKEHHTFRWGWSKEAASATI